MAFREYYVVLVVLVVGHVIGRRKKTKYWFRCWAASVDFTAAAEWRRRYHINYYLGLECSAVPYGWLSILASKGMIF